MQTAETRLILAAAAAMVLRPTLAQEKQTVGVATRDMAAAGRDLAIQTRAMQKGTVGTRKEQVGLEEVESLQQVAVRWIIIDDQDRDSHLVTSLSCGRC